MVDTQLLPVVLIDSRGLREKHQGTRDALIAEYEHLVRPIAERINRTTPPSFALDDLIQEGMLGLLAAATRYRPETGVPFPIYARTVIRGAILDSISGRNWREATMPEAVALPSIKEDHDARIDRQREAETAKRAIRKLAPKARRVIEIYYSEQGGDCAATGKVIGIDRRRVGETHSRALSKLRVMCANA